MKYKVAAIIVALMCMITAGCGTVPETFVCAGYQDQANSHTDAELTPLERMPFRRLLVAPIPVGTSLVEDMKTLEVNQEPIGQSAINTK